jgi:hypothetical protein
MTHDEHRAILAFIEHNVGGVQPPMDVEADAIIRALFVRNPDAAYRITMLAISLAPPVEREKPHRGWLFGLLDRAHGIRREPLIS